MENSSHIMIELESQLNILQTSYVQEEKKCRAIVELEAEKRSLIMSLNDGIAYVRNNFVKLLFNKCVGIDKEELLTLLTNSSYKRLLSNVSAYCSLIHYLKNGIEAKTGFIVKEYLFDLIVVELILIENPDKPNEVSNYWANGLTGERAYSLDAKEVKHIAPSVEKALQNYRELKVKELDSKIANSLKHYSQNNKL